MAVSWLMTQSQSHTPLCLRPVNEVNPYVLVKHRRSDRLLRIHPTNQHIHPISPLSFNSNSRRINMRRSSRMKVKRKFDSGDGTATCSSNSTVTIDLSESQHARKIAEGNKWRYEDDVDIKKFERISHCYSEVIPSQCKSKRRNHTCQLIAAAGPKGKLNSTAFHALFRILWDKFPEDKKALFAFLDCLWFRMYSEPTSKQKVLSWIKNTSILSKRYVIVPIVLWDHWNLLILCNFDESLESSTRKPCMLLLDSLENAGPTRYQPAIMKFVVDVFQALGRPVTKELLSKIPFMMPKVPQQRNDVECGRFVLYFIHLFVNAAPDAFDISNGHLNIMNEKWFDREGYEKFYSEFCVTD